MKFVEAFGTFARLLGDDEFVTLSGDVQQECGHYTPLSALEARRIATHDHNPLRISPTKKRKKNRRKKSL